MEYKISSKVYRNIARENEGEWPLITLTTVPFTVAALSRSRGIRIQPVNVYGLFNDAITS